MYQFTDYFEEDVLRRRPYLKKEWCIRVVESFEYTEEQGDGRFRFWAKIPELGGKYLRVIVEYDMITIHNAFIDKNFTPNW